MSTVLAFLLTIGLLVTIHEWGHYRAARACGVKVLRFSIGFGRPLLRWQRGETEFVLALLPLGGYVKMLDEREGPVDAAERARAFGSKTLAQRAFIVAAGPAANLVLAVLLYAAVHLVGTQEAQPILGTPPAGSLAAEAGLQAGDRVLSLQRGDEAAERPVDSYAELRWQLTRAALDGQGVTLQLEGPAGRRPLRLALDGLQGREVDAALLNRIGLAGPFSEPVLGPVQPAGPAAQAGLREGDRVLAVDERPVADAAALRAAIRAAAPAVPSGTAAPTAQPPAAASLRLDIDRAGQRLTLTLQPRLAEGEGGQRIARIDAYVGSPPASVLLRHGPLQALVLGAEKTGEIAVLSLRMLGRMLIGEASLKNLSGPLTIADVAGRSAEAGFTAYLGFLALVSVSLGVLNLLPLPMLDGGHLVYYIVEALTGRPISEIWLDRLQRGGLALMVAMMSLALYNDLARLLGLH